jgi:hypothetical protein
MSSVTSAIASKLPNSPVPEGDLKILNGRFNTGYKIAEMVSGGLMRGAGEVGGAANSSLSSPVAMAASASGSGGGGGATVNYSPTIHIGAGVSTAARADFMAMLRSHKDEIAAMLGQQSGRNDWLSYS